MTFCLKKHKITSKWVLGELTIIDFYFYEICFYINGFFNSYISTDAQLSRNCFLIKFFAHFQRFSKSCISLNQKLYLKHLCSSLSKVRIWGKSWWLLGKVIKDKLLFERFRDLLQKSSHSFQWFQKIQTFQKDSSSMYKEIQMCF